MREVDSRDNIFGREDPEHSGLAIKRIIAA
jgi:hypothetical protein